MRHNWMRTITRLALLLVLIAAGNVAVAQGLDPVFQSKTFKDADGDHRYAVFVPKGYSAEKKWPVMLFLHGAGERGTDGVLQTKIGIGPVLKKRAESFPFIVVLPQCEDLNARYLAGWLSETKDAQRALKILDAVEAEYSVDPDRRVLTGWSMGGFGTWSIAATEPRRWSAVVPLAGGGDGSCGPALSECSIWAFHGAKDGAIRVDQTRNMIAAIRTAGGQPRFTDVTDGEHDINPVVYDNETLIQWMLNPKTTAPMSLVLRATPSTTAAATSEPFVPAVEMSRAVTLRLGNDMLDALSMPLHELVPPEALTGRVGDIYDSTVVEGRQFSITFSGIAYGAKVSRIRLQAYREGRLNVQVGIKDAVMRIGGAYVSGRDHSASTGPIDVVMGYREPVWLSVDLVPFVENRRLRLKVAAASFNIQNDNWYVTAPAGVSVRGFGMTSDKVSNGLVNGLYGSKGRIEAEVLAIVPKLVAELESKLDLTEADQLVQGFWPLPVYKPRLKIRPEEVSVDKDGVSVVLGIVASSIDPKAPPAAPKRVEITPLAANSIDKTASLGVGIAPNILAPMTQMMVDADVAKIHVLDIPEVSFAKFIDLPTMQEVFPELKRHGDGVRLWTELSLAKPISVASGAMANEMLFQMPEMRLSVLIKPTKEAPLWQPFAEIRINIEQATIPTLVKVDRQTRLFQLVWSGDPQMKVEASFDKSYQPENKNIGQAMLDQLVPNSWRGWIGHGPAAQLPVNDIEIGITKVRLESVNWQAPMLNVNFTAPGVKITNSSTVAFSYETKGPFSGWGGPYTLEPGKSHEYPIAYPLTYRQKKDGESPVYILPPGSHSEFRVPQSGGAPTLFQAREELRSGDD